MDLSVKRIELAELGGANPFQSAFWATLKKRNGWRGLAFSSALGKTLVLTRPLGSVATLAYIPFGFNKDTTSEEIEAFARAVRPQLPKNTILLRIDTAWGNRASSPALHSCAFSVQPSGTVRIDLKKPLDFKERVARNLKKEAAVVVRRWSGDDDEFSAWYETYVHTAVRDHFSSRSEEYIRSLFTIDSSDVAPILYLAYSDGILSGGIVNLRTEREEVYLFGSSVKHTSNISCGYSLQAHAIMEAKKAGVETYDLFGIEGEDGEGGHLASLTTFKTAFGGEKVYRSTTMDYFYKPLLARAFRLVDSLRYRSARRSRI